MKSSTFSPSSSSFPTLRQQWKNNTGGSVIFPQERRRRRPGRPQSGGSSPSKNSSPAEGRKSHANAASFSLLLSSPGLFSFLSPPFPPSSHFPYSAFLYAFRAINLVGSEKKRAEEEEEK